jgi:outer membrane protein assembly factor BamB
MSLYDGTLYGVTNSVGGVASVFAINADTGAILWTSPVSSFNGSERLGTTLVPNAFGPGVHGLYWMFDNRTPETSGIRGVPVSPAAAGTAVSLGATRTSFSHIIYDQPANALYAPHWSDYGTSIEAFRPNGQLLWVARTDEFGFSLNGGFTPAHVLRPGGNGLIFAGFEGDFWLLNNPGDLGGGPLPASSALWYFNGPNEASEARDGGLIIADPVSGQQVYITGTTANTAANYARRIVAHRVSTGERIFEYFVPGDSGALGFGAGTCFSPAVDSRGDLYFGMVSQAVAGGDPKLVALTVEPCLANCDNSTTPPILNAGDFTCLLNRFRAAQSLPAAQQVTDYTNCDQSTTPPVLNAGDFTCFLTKFRAGCP